MANYTRMLKPRIISIEGNAGIGKSTLAKMENTLEWQRCNAKRQNTSTEEAMQKDTFINMSVDYADVCNPKLVDPQLAHLMAHKNGDPLLEVMYTGIQLSRIMQKWEFAYAGNCEFVYNDRELFSNLPYYLVNATAYNSLLYSQEDLKEHLDDINERVNQAATLQEAFENGSVDTRAMKDFYEFLIPSEMIDRVVMSIDVRASYSTMMAGVIQHTVVGYVDCMTWQGHVACKKIEKRLYENKRGDEYKDRDQVQKFCSVMPISWPKHHGYAYGPGMTEIISSVCSYTGLQGYVFKEVVKRSKYLKEYKNGYKLSGDMDEDQAGILELINEYHKIGIGENVCGIVKKEKEEKVEVKSEDIA